MLQNSVATEGSVTQIGDAIHGASYDVCLVHDTATGKICGASKQPLLTEITSFNKSQLFIEFHFNFHGNLTLRRLMSYIYIYIYIYIWSTHS